MVLFPNGKINIGLNILSKRMDGYHNLQTVFYPIKIKDAIEGIDSNDPTKEIHFSSSGIPIHGKTEDNLCIKAYNLLKKDFPQLPAITMHLHKVIPMGAGLGGGSADAALMLQLINTQFELQLSELQLLAYAGQLGSDAPFFIINKPCFATGRGEILELVELNLSAYKFFLLHPGIHISTALAFANISVGENNTDLKKAIANPIHQWKEQISNDFEKPIFAAYPEMATIKEQLYENGALYASMSGSGSTIYGIFPKDHIPKMKFPAHYFQNWV
jgi:4-diphosphocytidyl-2-C-methyl-D-erythritol kinase